MGDCRQAEGRDTRWNDLDFAYSTVTLWAGVKAGDDMGPAPGREERVAKGWGYCSSEEALGRFSGV